jgi:hypothetical protein
VGEELRRLAARWGLNPSSGEARELLENVDASVDVYISVKRKAVVQRRIPSKYVSSTPREALDAGDPTVRKLLLDKRWRKR